MDLSTIEGLTPEQVVAIEAMHNKETDGLRTNSQKILEEKREMQKILGAQDDDSLAAELATKLKAQQDALNKAAEEQLKKDKDIEGLKAHYEKINAEQLAAIKAESENARNALLERDKTSAMAELQGLLHPDRAYAGKVMLSNALNVSYNDEGKANFTFNHNGEVVADSIESFKSWAAENSDYKQVLRGVDSGGAGVTQSSGGISVGDSVQSRLSQRLKAQGI